jgi:hypothetical protein
MAITRTADFGYVSTSTTATTTGALTSTANIPVGYLVVVAIVTLQSTGSAPTLTLTSSPTNTWNKNQGFGTVTPSGSALMTVAYWTSVLTTALTTSSTFTINFGGTTMTRHAVAVAAFSDPVTGTFTNGPFFESPAGGSPTSTGSNFNTAVGSLTTGSTAGTTYSCVGAFGLVNSLRTTTPLGGWAYGTKFVSNGAGGSGERAIQIFYRDSAPSQSFSIANAPGNVSGSSPYTMGAFSYIAQGTSGPPVVGGYTAGTAKVWDGFAWVNGTAKVWVGAPTNAWVPATPQVKT